MVFIVSCSQTTTYTDTPNSGTIVIAADETFKPILEAELGVFHALYTGAKINVIYKTETEALNDLFKDSVRLILTSRPLTQKERDFFKAKKLFPKEVKIAIDGIALITNKENPDTLITMQVLRNILLGKITLWNQFCKGSKQGKVKIVFDNKNSSTVRFMLDSLLQGKKISDNNTTLENNSQVIDFITSNKNAIGVIGVSWISDSDDSTMRSFLKKVNVMAISNEDTAIYANSYQPYQGYIAQGHYPLTRNIYIINAEPRTGLATGFTAFVASERGQRIILKSGVLPATQPFRIIEVKEDL
jgi:phosphate transport system substrate-binding protein